MHPSSGANTKSADAGETVTFNWDETHDVWLMPDEAAYNSCTFTNAVEIHSTSVKTGAVSGLGETKYYACHVGSHCDSGQKIAMTCAGTDGRLPRTPHERRPLGPPPPAPLDDVRRRLPARKKLPALRDRGRGERRRGRRHVSPDA